MAVQVEGDGHGNVLQVIRVMGPRRPNSVCLSLDGAKDQVRLDYIHCQEDFRSWNDELAIVCGNNVSKVFTTRSTPTGSTFYYAITYKQNFLVFVIEGRTGWLHGYYVVTSIDGNLRVKGIHEFKSLQKEFYINHDRCIPLPFGGNHTDISGRIADTPIGLKPFRDAFDTILAYNGGAKYEGVNTAFGIIVMHICESLKLQPVFDRICEAFVNPSVRKLGKGSDISIPDSITKWTKLSRHGMRLIENPDYKVYRNEFPNISSEQVLTLVRVMNVDAYSGGPFKHDVATDPRHWEPLEPGTNVPSVADIPFLEEHIPFLEEHTYDERGGKDRDQQNGGQSGGKQKRGGDGKGRHHGKSKGKRGGGNRGQGQQEGGGGGRGRQRGGVSLSATGFPLIGGWSGGQGKEISMDQNPIGCVMKPRDLVCMHMPMCKPPCMTVMKESKYPWRQLIKNCSLTSLSFYMTNLQQQDLGTVVMTRGGDRLSWTEALKLIGTALLGLEEWYLIGWG